MRYRSQKARSLASGTACRDGLRINPVIRRVPHAGGAQRALNGAGAESAIRNSVE